MHIVTININKGGTGKSTFSYSFSKWLSSRKNKSFRYGLERVVK